VLKDATLAAYPKLAPLGALCRLILPRNQVA